MPNQQTPNPSTVTQQVTSVSSLIEQSIDGVSSLSLQSLYNLSAGNTSVGRYLRERATLLRGMVNEIDRPILKGLATDMINTMAGWFEDPEVLCCLINAIWMAYAEEHNEDPNELPDNFSLNLSETGFGSFLDALISFIDLIIAFLTQDLKKIVFFIPDFIKEIFQSVMGAILLILQEVLYTIRDSVLQGILDWIDERIDAGATWASCLPMQQFINIIKKYVNDYGLFAEIMEKIRGYVSGKRSTFKQLAELVPNAKDLEFLFWLRDLLIKLKQATVNFDLCVEYAYIPDNNYTSDPIEPENTTDDDNDDTTSSLTDVPALAKVSMVVSDDGQTVILNDNDSRIRPEDIRPSDRNRNGMYISRLSNDSIANFIKNNYGFSNAVIEQSLRRQSDGCPGFPGGEELRKYLNSLRNRT